MVEDSIRRILPTVMNEVLLRTISDSGMLAEGRPARPRKMKRRRPVREARAPQPQARRPGPPKKGGRRKLDEILDGIRDPGNGADFYQDPRALMMESAEPEYAEPDDEEYEEEPPPPPRKKAAEARVSALPPELRGLVEGMDLDGEDSDEMWGANEHDSAPMLEAATPTDPSPIRDVNRAAQAAGVDFSRMKSVIAATSPAKVDRRQAAEDARARQQFEQARLARMRDKLGGVKPPE
ncbi:MAG TPA: hypothetical protein VFT74_18955 [Isosphaeraceae bacterium]|nr:hypothetical protein [Isosphaeraceae bacterium]